MKTTTDVKVVRNGTLVLFTVYTPKAAKWIRKNVHIEDYMWINDNTFACEHRMSNDLIAALKEHKFTLAVEVHPRI